ncbi:MAG: hypothetical protein JW719_01910 [Pirellulales bacterium]|nr:hypothetical protein [Pirellulales bacterium]
MNDRLKTLVALTLGVTLFLAVGCNRTPSRVHPPGIDADAAGKAAMDQYDANKDGKVAGEELQKAPSLNAAIDNLDKDGDKAVSAEEVTERIKAWQDSRLGRTSIMIAVTYRGQPLDGAKVVFEPEQFLGAEVQPASGTTDPYGRATLNIENSKIPGIAPGLYKVKITKDGMNIPAKYNTETTLGAEVARDAKDAETGPTFNLN